MNKKAIVAKIIKDVDLQIALDDMIRDRFEIMASNLNNEGIEAQLDWLKLNCIEDYSEILVDLKHNAELDI